MQYSDMFKHAMIQKMSGPDPISATALSKQVNVPQSTLSKWLRMAGVDPSFDFPNNAHEYTKMAKINEPKRPNDWSAEDKLKVVMEASALDDEQLGAFLRSKGLHQTYLDQWRSQMLNALQNASSKKNLGETTLMPNAFEPWKRRSIEKTKPWLRQRPYWF